MPTIPQGLSTASMAKTWSLAGVDINKRALLWASCLLLLGLAASALLNINIRERQISSFNAAFKENAQGFVDDLTNRLSRSSPSMYATRALFVGVASQPLSIESFHQYVNSWNLVEDLPTASGIGYAVRVQREQQDAFISLARANGRPDFQIRESATHSGDRLVVQYIEPEFSNQHNIGLDLASMPIQLAAASLAIARNQPVLSQPEIHSRTDNPGIWFSLFLPVYKLGATVATVEQRQQALQGLIFIPMNLGATLDDLLEKHPYLQVRIRSLQSNEDFFKSINIKPKSSNAASFVAQMNLYGSQWQLHIDADQSYDSRLRPAAINIATASAVLTSLLAAFLTYSLLNNLTRRRQEKLLKALLAAIVGSVEESIISQDLQGHITSWNLAAEKLFDIDAQVAMGRNFDELVTLIYEDDDDASLIARAERGEAVAPVRCLLARQDAQATPLLISVSAVYDEKDQLLGYARVVRDMTHQDQLEAELRESQKMQAIGQLTGGLAHDFNNLLGVVIGNLDELQSDLPVDNTKVQRRLHAAQDAAQRGAKVAYSLLAMAHRQPLQVLTYDINALLIEMMPLLRSSVGADVSLGSYLGALKLFTQIDASGLSNVLLNLIINSRDAMQGQTHEKWVRISTRLLSDVESAMVKAQAQSRTYIEIKIQDNGPGMSQAVQSRAFEPFFTTKGIGHGTGLGLFMVHSFATQFGGAVTLKIADACGTSVYLYLPLDERLQAELQAQEDKRLQALHALKVLDTPPESAFDDLVQKATQLFNVPVAYISLIDRDRQWFKARVGIPLTQTPREMSFCDHAVHGSGALVVEDTALDVRFSANPLVLGDPHIRFYAGIPLQDDQGNQLGALCVIDTVPRAITATQLSDLEQLAQGASALLAPRGKKPAWQRRADDNSETISSTDLAIPVVVAQAISASPKAENIHLILVVDDEPELLALASHWLKTMGYTVICAASPIEALDLLEQHSVDLLFTDVIMPGSMDGIELAHMSLKRYPKLRILMTSGYTGDHTNVSALPGPMLQKPYRKKDLMLAMQQF